MNTNNSLFIKKNNQSIPVKLESPVAGLKLNTENHRSIIMMSLSDAKEHLEPELYQAIENAMRISYKSKKQFRDALIVANFKHQLTTTNQARYFIAIIPKDIVVSDIHLELVQNQHQKMRSQLRFILNAPIQLIPQASDTFTAFKYMGPVVFQPQVVGIEDAQPDLQKDRFFRSMNNEHSMAYSFVTNTPNQQSLIKTISYPISRYNQNQKRSLFVRALNYSNNAQNNHIFNPIFRNSLTSSLEVLELQLSDHIYNPHSLIGQLEKLFPNYFQNRSQSNKRQVSNSINSNPSLSILADQTIDPLLVELAHFINKNKIPYSTIKAAIESAHNRTPSKTGATLNPRSQNFLDFIQRQWKRFTTAKLPEPKLSNKRKDKISFIDFLEAINYLSPDIK